MIREVNETAKKSRNLHCDRVVTRYIGSGIKGLESAGIRDHSPGIWNHNARDRDQQCSSLDQQIFAGSGIKILGTNLGSGTKSIPRYDPVIPNIVI